MKQRMVEATHPTAEKILKYYSWRATNYDAGSGFEAEHHEEALRLADVQEGQHVLDVAAGTGRRQSDSHGLLERRGRWSPLI
jgi:ubiquinone/menaquinone biosynthesis C-methylase UbiE